MMNGVRRALSDGLAPKSNQLLKAEQGENDKKASCVRARSRPVSKRMCTLIFLQAVRHMPMLRCARDDRLF